MRFTSFAVVAAIMGAASAFSADTLTARDHRVESIQRLRDVRRSVQGAAAGQLIDRSTIIERSSKYDPKILHTLCTSDAMCAKYAQKGDVPDHGSLYCNTKTKHCAQKCDSGYQYKEGKCFSSAAKCGKQSCGPKPANGFYNCSNNGKCSLGCAEGYFMIKHGKDAGKACFNPQTDANHCGNEYTQCPAAYQGRGTAACKQGSCTLNCPSGQSIKRTKAKKIAYCSAN